MISLRKRKDRNLWEARVRLNGRWTSFYAQNSEAARQKAESAASESALPELITDATVGGFIALQVMPLYVNRSDKQRKHAGLFLRTINAAIGDIEPEKLTLAHCQSLMDAYAKTHAHGSCANLRKYLFKVCRLLARNGRIRWNYAEDVRNPVRKAKPVVPTTTEAVWLLESLDGHHFESLVFLCFGLGLRREEACNVRVEDIGRGELLVRGTKTAGAARTIYLPKCIEDELVRLAARSKRFLVETVTSSQLTTNYALIAREMYDWACLPHYGYHKLRHAFGSIETELGCPRAVRLSIMGHSTAKVEDRYQHADQGMMREWLERWWDFLNARRAECLREVCGYAVGTESEEGVKI